MFWTPTTLAFALANAAVLLLFAVAWLATLRKHLRIQTEMIRSRVEREAVLEARYRDLFENASDVMYTRDLDGNFTSVNAAGEHVTGYSRDEFLRMNVAQLFVGASVELDPEGSVVTLNASPELATADIVCRNGDIRTLELSRRPIWTGRHITGVQVIARDLTERRNLEKRMVQGQKMQAVGKLAGGIAHDFNNLLMVINSYTELLDTELPEGRLRKYYNEILKSVERGAGLTRQLLAFSRQQVLSPKLVDLNALINDQSTMLRRVIGEDIELIVATEASLRRVKADPLQIEQVIVNLVLNARDAMPTGGKLMLETGNAEFDDAYTQRHPSVVPGQYAMFAVSDTGAGMSHDVKAHLFEPFFTTKAVGQGTGMGLATVYGIVQQSGGHISVYSNEGVGSTFKVFLPESETGKPAEQPAKAEPPKPGSETILLVEDEEGVRESAAEYLARLGYRVITAIDGEQAVALAAAQNGPIHLLLTDIVMPHMSGRDVANQLHTAHPEIAVLFISGYTDNMLSNYIAPGEQINFLQKPFSLRQLAMKVREVLEQRPTPAGSAR